MMEKEPKKEDMWPCGPHEMKPEESKEVSDGLNGTLYLGERQLKAIKAKPGSTVRILAEANGRQVETKRTVHQSGNSVTLPASERRKLDLSVSDEVDVWVELIERESEDKGQSRGKSRTSDDDMDDQLYVWFIGDEVFHRVESGDADETACSLELSEREHKITEDPGGFLDLCKDCAVRSSSEMTNEEIVDWLADEAEFEKSGGPPSYFNKGQLVALRDAFIELQDQANEYEQTINELNGRIGQLTNRIDEEEDDEREEPVPTPE